MATTIWWIGSLKSKSGQLHGQAVSHVKNDSALQQHDIIDNQKSKTKYIIGLRYILYYVYQAIYNIIS